MKFDSKIFARERKKRGLSFEKLATLLKQAGFTKASKQLCWKWEVCGQAPSAAYLVAIASLFERPTDYFFSKPKKQTKG